MHDLVNNCLFGVDFKMERNVFVLYYTTVPKKNAVQIYRKLSDVYGEGTIIVRLSINFGANRIEGEERLRAPKKYALSRKKEKRETCRFGSDRYRRYDSLAGTKSAGQSGQPSQKAWAERQSR